MKSHLTEQALFTMDDLLSPEECAALIAMADRQGYEPAPIITASGTKISTETRNNDRLVFDDTPLAALLWGRSRHAVPPRQGDRIAVGLNERFRLYRYSPGQRFSWHADVPYRRGNDEISLLTYIVYLNGDYEGGETRFEFTKVAGREGSAIVFQHGLIHQGAEVKSGVKYALRTDVMYSHRNDG